MTFRAKPGVCAAVAWCAFHTFPSLQFLTAMPKLCDGGSGQWWLMMMLFFVSESLSFVFVYRAIGVLGR